ncbi:hypothetical protein Vadar_033753 [Vaccinium darrowii]|uniref:Uncharacterized protein n=1 Tax=Vaccinium darrowii TaxID=229202 RepID=A0ACB7Z0Y8_9ERIC|nr:hypothetical protein Vadar_033753 [Vaccinium darrowii]
MNFKKADGLTLLTNWKKRYDFLMATKKLGPLVTILHVRLLNAMNERLWPQSTSSKPSAEACMKWLDTKQKGCVVYASFRSLASLSKNQMEEIARGLKNSGSYLWVVRDFEESKLPPCFMEETSKAGAIVNWCSQLEVVAHQAVGCFMTHCGWKSTLKALSSGFPLVIVNERNAGFRVKANDKGIITRGDRIAYERRYGGRKEGMSLEGMLFVGKNWPKRSVMKVEALLRTLINLFQKLCN